MSEVVFENKGEYAISREPISIIANGDELLERLGYKKYKRSRKHNGTIQTSKNILMHILKI